MSDEEIIETRFIYSSYRNGRLWCEGIDPFVVINQSREYEDCKYYKTVINTIISSKIEVWNPVTGEL